MTCSQSTIISSSQSINKISSTPSERELCLINARRKLKNYRLKQAAAANPIERPCLPSTTTTTTTTTINHPSPALLQLSPLPPSSSTSSLLLCPSPTTTRHKHTRTHSRNQSRSSLASILVAHDQVNIIDDVLAHHRRLSLSSKPSPLLSQPSCSSSSSSSSSSRPDPLLHPSVSLRDPSSPALLLLTPSSSSFFDSASLHNRDTLLPPTTTPTLLSTPWPSSSDSLRHSRSSSFSQNGHVRRESKHMRKNSVSTRRESIEIMGGLGIMGIPSTTTTTTTTATDSASRSSFNRATWSGTTHSGRPDPLSPPNSSNSSTTTFIPNGQSRIETDVQLARLAALDALEGKSSPDSTAENINPTHNNERASPSAADPSMSPASDGASLQSITPRVSTPAYHDLHGTFQRHSFARAGEFDLLDSISPNLAATTGSLRKERRMSWVNHNPPVSSTLTIMNPGSVLVAAPTGGGATGLSWPSATSGMALVSDLSRVEEEEEEEEEDQQDDQSDGHDLTMISSNSIVAQPRAMETVAEEEEEEDETDTRQSTPSTPSKLNITPLKRRPHSLVFTSRSQSNTPTGSPLLGYPARSQPSLTRRGVSSSMSLPSNSASLVKLKPLALTSPNFIDPAPTYGIMPTTAASSSSAGSSSFPGHHFFNPSVASSSVSSSPVPGVKFDRPGSSCPMVSGAYHYNTGSTSTIRSSLSGSFSGPTTAPKPTSITPRPRSSISYSKSPSPEHAKLPLTVCTTLAKVSRVSLAEPSPTHSTSSKTSSQLDREQAHDDWKLNLERSLQQRRASSSARGHETFGDLVMAGSDEEGGSSDNEKDEAPTTTLSSSAEMMVKQAPEQDAVGRRCITNNGPPDQLRTSAAVDPKEPLLTTIRPERKMVANQEEEMVAAVVGHGGGQVQDDTKHHLSDLKRLVAELEAEKAELQEDVEGFKLRLKFLEGQMLQEKTKSAEYERDLGEKDQLIEGLLRKRSKKDLSASSRSTAEEEADELKVAQIKLINEMRDQIFALASALEKERSEHLATKEALEAAAMQIEVNELEEDGPVMATLFSDEEVSSVVECEPRRIMDEAKKVVQDINLVPGPSTDTTDLLEDLLPPGKPDRSPAMMTSNEEVVNETRMSSTTSTDSQESCLPKTPSVEKIRHHRSESFIRHWSFPKGPVTSSSRSSSEDDHCFFFRPNSIDITLPPVEPAKEVLVPPPFLFSYLHHEEPMDAEQHSRRYNPSQKVELRSGGAHQNNPAVQQQQKRPPLVGDFVSSRGCKEPATVRSPFSSVSSIQSSTVGGGARDNFSTGRSGGGLTQSLSKQLSLQNLSSWVGSYVGGGAGSNGGSISLNEGHVDDKFKKNLSSKDEETIRLEQLEKLNDRISKRTLGHLDFRKSFEGWWITDDKNKKRDTSSHYHQLGQNEKIRDGLLKNRIFDI